MAENITGSVVGKVKFQIDQPSWKNLEKFQAKLTAVKRQMSTLHKTIKVQAVIKQMTDVTKKVTNNSISEKKREMNAHVAAKQKHDTQVARLYDQALAEDRRRDNTRIRQAERMNAQLLKSDLRLDAQRRAAAIRQSKIDAKTSAGTGRYRSRAEMYTEVKMQQARIAGVDAAGLDKIRNRSSQMMTEAGGDIAKFRHGLQQTTKDLIHNTRELNKNRVTLRSLRTDLVQMTAAYTAFSGVVNIAQTGLDMEGLRASAKVFAKDEVGVADHMKFIADEADRLGVNLMTATKEFTKFAISTKNKVGQDSARQIFSGVSEYASVLQADQQQFERAFRSINQMLSKGNLMAEEVRGQLGESLFGAIPILAQAYGFSADQKGEEAFFKAMERGELAATEDKFLAFAKGLSAMARSNGALEAVTKKTRAEMNRFFNELTLGKDLIFGSGFGEGLSYMFGQLSDTLKTNQDSFKAFGAAFKGVVTTLVAGIKLIIAPFELLFKAMYSVFGEKGIAVVFATLTGIKVVSSLMAIGTAARFMAGGFTLANLSLMTLLKNLGKFAVLPTLGLAVEDYATYRAGGSSLGSKSFWGNTESAIMSLVNPLSNNASNVTQIMIGWKSEEAKKLIDATVDKKNQSSIANLDDENQG